jgi:cytochrome c-type biogenesis protein CcmE
MNPRRKKRLLGVVAIVFGIGAAIGLIYFIHQVS